MTGQTIAEKILSAHANKAVYAGDVVVSAIDLIMATDGSGPLAIHLFEQMKGKRTFDPEKIIMVLDHYVPCPNDKVAAMQDGMRAFAAAGRCAISELGMGICHRLFPEQRRIKPGALVVGGDSHSTTYGAFNAIGAGVGSSDLAAAMITGKLWFQTPETIRIALTGRLRPHVAAKDLALSILGRLTGDGASYKAVEFAGDGASSLSMDERMTVCNLMAETGAKCAIMPADEKTEAFLGASIEKVEADKDARYEKTVEIDLSALEPMIALPHRPDNVAAARAKGRRCTWASWEPVRTALSRTSPWRWRSWETSRSRPALSFWSCPRRNRSIWRRSKAA